MSFSDAAFAYTITELLGVTTNTANILYIKFARAFLLLARFWQTKPFHTSEHDHILSYKHTDIS